MVTASARTRPAFMYSIAPTMVGNETCLSGNQVDEGGRRSTIGHVVKLTPAIILNNSPQRWLDDPFPPDAMLSLPGLALARSMSAGIVVARTDGCTTTNVGH